LPRDLRYSESPFPGLAGYALLTVPMIALKRCGEVHDDWLWGGVIHAAAASTSGKVYIVHDPNKLRREELLFLSRWWDECNPTHTAVDPAWLKWNGGTVASLAKSIYDQRRFQDLPILADALEEAGCADAELLGHCRRDGPHVPGCWAIDAILGKE
jgi:hypothetical protein